MRLIGGHVSAAGGVDKAMGRAHEIGGNCAQVFSGSPRVWQRAELSAIDDQKMSSERQKYHVEAVFTHALYLINLASENAEMLRKSTEAIIYDLKFDALVKGSGVVVHLGSHTGRGWAAVRDQVASAISEILSHAPKESRFLMENAAGQNGKIGGDLTELRWLLDQVDSPQLGWCLDTCHTFAAGYGLGKTQTLKPQKPENAERLTALEEIEKLKLADKLWCVHVNDTKDEFGSSRDRHQNLGDGNIPAADLKYFLNHSLIKDKPLIIEVPGIEDQGPDLENIQRLRKIVGENHT